jgi:endogenous inhibitor of DNA gyrase (YacG/DUF329 family)
MFAQDPDRVGFLEGTAVTVRNVSCPSCGAAVPWGPDSPYRPFCSERCKLVDLGAWATEKYRVAKPHNEADDESVPGSGSEESPKG